MWLGAGPAIIQGKQLEKRPGRDDPIKDVLLLGVMVILLVDAEFVAVPDLDLPPIAGIVRKEPHAIAVHGEFETLLVCQTKVGELLDVRIVDAEFLFDFGPSPGDPFGRAGPPASHTNVQTLAVVQPHLRLPHLPDEFRRIRVLESGLRRHKRTRHTTDSRCEHANDVIVLHP